MYRYYHTNRPVCVLLDGVVVMRKDVLFKINMSNGFWVKLVIISLALNLFFGTIFLMLILNMLFG